MEKWLNPITLEGEVVKLIPLVRAHHTELIDAAKDGELWELWYTGVPSAETMDAYLDFAFEQQDLDRALCFCVWHKQDKKIIGTTRFCNAEPEHKRLEIGYTWYAKSYQRTAVNTECKHLLLRFAFEDLACIAVEIRTHFHNHRSRKAIARLGAKQDGILRNHRQHADGSFRDTVVFSIVQQEWPTVRKALRFKMSS